MYILALTPISREDYLETQQVACGNLLFKLGKLDAIYIDEDNSFKNL